MAVMINWGTTLTVFLTTAASTATTMTNVILRDFQKIEDLVKHALAMQTVNIQCHNFVSIIKPTIRASQSSVDVSEDSSIFFDV